MPDSEETHAFSSLLREQRLAADLTQAAFAERAGLAARTIQDLERGIAQPRRETVRRLVAVLAPPTEVRAHFEAATPTPRDRSGQRDGGPRPGRSADRPEPGPDRVIHQPDWPGSLVRLPNALTPTVGREADLTALASLLARTRLLTLTGVGGVGKTRLAIETARTVQNDYADGVWLVELAALADPMLVPQTAAKAFGIAEQPGRPLLETLADVLQTRRVLMVLDNCEHLLDACAELVERLLTACDGVRVLATSREPIGVDGEVVWRMPPLTVPDGEAAMTPAADLTEYGAVQLFVDRAQQARPGFVLTDESTREVVEICRRLDGIPLAIELAAARVSSLAVGQIAARLDDELMLLTRGPRTAAPRHRTLRATLDWSYDLLAELEQRLLRRLAVFAGGWTLDTAETVCSGDGLDRAEILDLLSKLVDASLVIVEERSGEARYRLLEPIRQYALEQLRQTAGEAAVRARHASWCLTLAEQAEPELWMADQLRWFARLDAEHDNLRAALAWSVHADHGADIGLRLAGALHHFWDVRGYLGEGRHWLEDALRRAADDPGPMAAKALVGVALLAHRQGVRPSDFARATDLCTQAFELAQRHRDTRHAVLALTQIGLTAGILGNYEQARRTLEGALALARDAGDLLATAGTLGQLGRLEEYEGDYPRAEMVLEEALALHRERGDRVSTAWTIATLSLVARRQGAFERAVSLGEECLALYRELRDRNGLAFVLQNLGRVAHHQGDYARARSTFDESVRLWSGIGSRASALRSLEGLAGVIAAEGRPERGVRLLVATDALNASIGRTLSPAEQAVYEQLLASARAELDDADFAAADAEGRAMSFDQAVAYALETPASSASMAACSALQVGS